MRKRAILALLAITFAAGSLIGVSISVRNAVAQSGQYFVNAINLDIAPDQFDKFMEAARENAAASVKDPGCREFNVLVAQNDPHHVMFFEVYDNAAALDAHRQTDHYKKYQAATKDMATKRDIRQFWSVAMNLKGA